MGKLTFGKFKGFSYADVMAKDSKYLLWLLENVNIDSKLYDYIVDNLSKIKSNASKERAEFLRDYCDNEYGVEY